MKKLAVFSAALMFAGLSLAQSTAPVPAKTRAEVIAELQQARASGELAAMHSEVGVNGYEKATARSVMVAKPAADKASAAPAAVMAGK